MRADCLGVTNGSISTATQKKIGLVWNVGKPEFFPIYLCFKLFTLKPVFFFNYNHIKNRIILLSNSNLFLKSNVYVCAVNR